MESRSMRIEDAMSTDLVTIHPDEPIEMAANLMDWNRVRHVPVEGDDGVVVGLVSYLEVLKYFNREGHRDDSPLKVGSVMDTAPATVSPETSVLDAVQMMSANGSDCLIVAQQGRLVGVVTAKDLVSVMASLLDGEEAPSE